MIQLNKKPICPEKYPDGTIRMNGVTVDNKNSADILWAYDNDEEMMVLYCLVGHLQSNYPGIQLTLRLPYLPNARMDRVHDRKTEVFTLKYFANFLNSLNFSAVKVWDVHSDISAALIDRIEVIAPTKLVEYVIEDIKSRHSPCQLLLFYPDEGSMKRYSERYKYPYAFGIKKRDFETGIILGLDIVNAELVNDRCVLIIDDICSKGGTFYYSAKKLKELGAKDIYLYITHCENTVFNGELLNSGLVNKIYTTDTIFTNQHPKIEVVHRFR